MHDSQKQEWASLCRFGQLYVRQEPTDVYRGVDADNNRRPDLEIKGLRERNPRRRVYYYAYLLNIDHE